MKAPNFESQREEMVRMMARWRGVYDSRVLDAMRATPREEFVPHHLRNAAYDDAPLPIGHGQTISQPLVVALMAQAIAPAPGDRVLDVGTGSGYAAAVLAEIVAQVFSIEVQPDLARAAARRLRELGYDNVEVTQGDGSQGWPEHAPYDGVVVAAASGKIPGPLLDQLKVGGRLVIPVGSEHGEQVLMRVIRESDEQYRQESLGPVRFVPLVSGGPADWEDSSR